jgi:hypothetical protein
MLRDVRDALKEHLKREWINLAVLPCRIGKRSLDSKLRGFCKHVHFESLSAHFGASEATSPDGNGSNGTKSPQTAF